MSSDELRRLANDIETLHNAFESGLLESGRQLSNYSKLQTIFGGMVEANLQEARLVRANLQGANLFQANLQGADLARADLKLASLNDAVLREANLQNADLTDSTGLQAPWPSTIR